MSEILAITLHGMHQDLQRVDQVAANMANLATPGYKRQAIIATAFGDMVDQAATARGRVLEHGLEAMADMRVGALKSTGAALDLALDGDGFFEVATAAGPAYTRQGNFRIDARGRLTTQSGDPVMGRAGEIFVNGANPAIDAQGNVSESGPPGPDGSPAKLNAGQIKVMKFEHAATMQPLGAGLYGTTEAGTQLIDGQFHLRQGFLESANVNSLQEMMNLMQTMRHFETLQKTAQGYDDMIGSAIRKLGENG